MIIINVIITIISIRNRLIIPLSTILLYYIIASRSSTLSFVLNLYNKINSIVIKASIPLQDSLITLLLLFPTCAVNRITQRTTPRYSRLSVDSLLSQGSSPPYSLVRPRAFKSSTFGSSSAVPPSTFDPSSAVPSSPSSATPLSTPSLPSSGATKSTIKKTTIKKATIEKIATNVRTLVDTTDTPPIRKYKIKKLKKDKLIYKQAE